MEKHQSTTRLLLLTLVTFDSLTSSRLPLEKKLCPTEGAVVTAVSLTQTGLAKGPTHWDGFGLVNKTYASQSIPLGLVMYGFTVWFFMSDHVQQMFFFVSQKRGPGGNPNSNVKGGASVDWKEASCPSILYKIYKSGDQRGLIFSSYFFNVHAAPTWKPRCEPRPPICRWRDARASGARRCSGRCRRHGRHSSPGQSPERSDRRPKGAIFRTRSPETSTGHALLQMCD